MTFVFGLLVGVYLGMCFAAAVYAAGRAHRTSEPVRVLGRQLPPTWWAHTFWALWIALVMPLGFLHDLFSPGRPWILWDGPAESEHR